MSSYKKVSLPFLIFPLIYLTSKKVSDGRIYRCQVEYNPRLRSFNHLDHSQCQVSFRHFLNLFKSGFGISLKIDKEIIVVVGL